MIRVLILCHGNICRSPMGEYILKWLAEQRGLGQRLFISSAATSREAIGCDVYPPARRCLNAHGIPCPGRRAVQLRPTDYEAYDWILYMERYNEKGIFRILGSDPQKKVRRLLDFSPEPRDIADPWYTGDFEQAYEDIVQGCETFLDYLEDRI